jgi:putative ubiquitin-RnfH superfamily antitoxin RatB of RatAB toxin-antitoxin module
MAPEPTVNVQVCYASDREEILRDLVVAEGTTIQEAIMQSGVLRDGAEVDLSVCHVGIYGKLKTMDTVLRERDRIEIYRPLIADPKDARHRRVKAERKTLATIRSMPNVRD